MTRRHPPPIRQPARRHAAGQRRRRTICGIAGIRNAAGQPVARDTLARLCGTIVHRGPDSEGLFTDGDFGFGMRRLSIIDLVGSDQPIFSADGRHAIVFNGEIYNYRGLRDSLAALGHPFSTDGDTEVILAAWREWGEAAWDRLDGMFAVAIWDRPVRRLILARDPIGIKPLYYSWQDGTLAFGSELKVLRATPGLRFTPDPRAIHDYFSFGHVRAPRSIYHEVQVLPPGHTLTLAAGGDPVLQPFWTARYTPAPPRPLADWVEQFRTTWLEAVRGQMLAADVEVGAFLSGGVDSSAVVAAMTQVAARPIKTFTIGFAERAYDESPHAEAVARHLGCDHRTERLSPGAARDILPAIARAYDEPFADPSAVPTWYLSRLAAEEVKVALSGDGGDELFFGYKRHLTERRLSQLPAAIRRTAGAVAALPPLPWRAGNRRWQRWQKTARSAALPDGGTRFFAKTQITSPELRRRLFAGTLLDGRDGDDAIAALAREYYPDMAALSHDPLEQFALADLQLNLPGAMLTKVDRASMAHSLEVRVPMLSRAVVDLALSMPADVKLHRGVGKYPVRAAVAPWLPPGILDRRKQGFQVPLAEWFAGDFGRYVEELWRDSGAAQSRFLNEAAVTQLFAEHRSGRRDHGRLLYALAIFCLWWMA
ncbi:asparagine synthase (glutamine-hydrolysing) [Sphingomonas guangdongensis]|uniref:asparagine synthase (glutamine-hydrolyzing) n=1 Tax=Sphingomonas guangdongensis TaxID=1141890 RepID=A0A285QYV4_9SPHN|nr:asparagine synthase (glutamine-hydrolyzing) [Sphingomonas guangdongensis]SOB87016.1 asparagine synthase (glutamine-hydrolysing) [Sphingomonas guangdongensis]